jgi:protein-disulfide isomerase
LLLGLLVASLVWQAPAGAQSKAAAAPVEKALGSKSAPITMEVFSDYQCPHCRDFYLQTVKPLIDNYVLTGKVYLIHRDMPLPTNPYSRRAARYANAAAQVKQLEKVMDVLYSKQLLWSADGDVDRVVAEVLTPAEMHQVRQLVQSGKLDAAIESDMARGRAYRVRQTPTIIVTHRGESVSIESAVSYTLLRRYLDDLLKK